jgi:hypothetical protein
LDGAVNATDTYGSALVATTEVGEFGTYTGPVGVVATAFDAVPAPTELTAFSNTVVKTPFTRLVITIGEVVCDMDVYVVPASVEYW